MKQLFHREILIRIALLLISTLAAILISEIVLRALWNHKGYYVRPPYLRLIFKPSPGIMPGIDGESRFITNSRGIRGDEFSHDQTYRILAIGASATECLYLDQSEAWPYLLQKKLNESSHYHGVWVGNVGKSGLNTREHILEMRYLLSQYPKIDAVIMLIGVNDFLMRLSQDINYNPQFLDQPGSEEQLLRRAFSILPERYDDTLPFYRRTAIWHLARKFKQLVFQSRQVPSWQVEDGPGKGYITRRELRRNAVTFRNALPDLSSALEEYTRNINSIIDLATHKSIRLILVTQPVLWKPGLSKQLNDLLWLGVANAKNVEVGKEYYSVEALATGMGMYNETLIRTCLIRQVECFDLASLLPKDTTVFYDDCHFNESGSEKVAKALSEYILQHNPFKESDKDN